MRKNLGEMRIRDSGSPGRFPHPRSTKQQICGRTDDRRQCDEYQSGQRCGRIAIACHEHASDHHNVKKDQNELSNDKQIDCVDSVEHWITNGFPLLL